MMRKEGELIEPNYNVFYAVENKREKPINNVGK